MTEVTYVKFRYTLERFDKPDEIATQLALVFKPYSVCTAGYEELNSSGMETHPHIHVHFDTLEAVKNIRGRFKTWLKKKGDFRSEDGNKGSENKVYAMGVPKDNEGLRSISRFKRYPWKQQHRIRFVGEKLGDWDEEDVHDQLIAAKTEYDSNVDRKNIDRAKAEAKASNSTFSKLERACENTKITCFEDICEVALVVAVENEIAVNFATLSGYCLTYALKHKLINRKLCIRKMHEISGAVGNSYSETAYQDEQDE